MAYTKTNWQNGVTPVSANNMNKIETGIDEAHQAIETPNYYTETFTELIHSLYSSIVEGQVNAVLFGNTRTNLVPLFDSGEWSLHSNVTVNSSTKITLNATSGYQLSSVIFSAKENQNYTISLKDNLISGQYVEVDCLDENGTKISPAFVFIDSGNKLTFTSYAGTEKIKVILTSTTTGTYTFENVMLEEGTEVNTFITGTKSTVSAIRNKSVGKNLFDGKFEIGSLSNTTGEKEYVATRLRSVNKIEVEENTYYTLSNNLSYTCLIYVYDKYDNLLSYIPSGNPNTFITPQNTDYVLFRTSNDEDDINVQYQLEEGTSATDYEEYQESEQYIQATDSEGNILELRSLPNGTNDEVNATSGEKIQRVSDEYSLTQDDIIGIETLTNVQRARISRANMTGIITSTGGTRGHTNFYSFNEYTGDTANIDDVSNENTYLYDTSYSSDLFILLPLNTYADLTSAKAGLEGETLIYQVAKPKTSYIPTSPLTCYKNGTLYIEPISSDVGFYDATNGIQIVDINYPIEELDKLHLVNTETGEETPLDLDNVTVAEDGQSFTSTDLTEGDCVWYAFEYDSALTTIPTIEATFPTNIEAQVNSNTDGIKSLDEKTNMHIRNKSIHCGINYYQSSAPTETTKGKTWFNTDTGNLYIADGKSWKSMPPAQILQEILTFMESDIIITHNGTTVFNDAIEIGEGETITYGTTATRDLDNDEVYDETDKNGIQIEPKKKIAGVKFILSANTSTTNSKTVYLYENDGTTLLATTIIGAGETQGEIKHNLNAGQKYMLVLDRNGSIYDSGRDNSNTFPYTSADIDITSGVLRMSLNGLNSYNIASVTSINLGTSASAIVKWDSLPSEIKAWDLATYHKTEDGETITIDIESSADGETWNNEFSDIDQNFDISTIDETKKVRFKLNFSRSSTSNNPTINYLARRFIR